MEFIREKFYQPYKQQKYYDYHNLAAKLLFLLQKKKELLRLQYIKLTQNKI